MNIDKCEPKTRNTASSRCKYEWGMFRRIVVTPLKKVYTGLDENNLPVTFDEWLLRGIHAAIIKEGNKGLTQSYNQDFCLSNRLASFNDGITRRAFIFDNKGKVWGCSRNGGKAGFESDLFCTTADITQASEISEPKVDYTFKVPEEFAMKEPIDTDLSPIELEGLEDVQMVAQRFNTVTEIRFYSLCGGQDVTSEMAAISGIAGCWLMDGSPMSSPPDFTDGIFKIFNTALTGSELRLAAPDVLYANGLAFKECQTAVKLS